MTNEEYSKIKQMTAKLAILGFKSRGEQLAELADKMNLTGADAIEFALWNYLQDVPEEVTVNIHCDVSKDAEYYGWGELVIAYTGQNKGQILKDWAETMLQDNRAGFCNAIRDVFAAYPEHHPDIEPRIVIDDYDMTGTLIAADVRAGILLEEWLLNRLEPLT